jgi:hypothetical protein
MGNLFRYIELTGHFKIYVHGDVISLYIPRAYEHDPSMAEAAMNASTNKIRYWLVHGNRRWDVQVSRLIILSLYISLYSLR